MSLLPPLIVVDTNVLLVSLPEQSPYHWLFKAIRNGTVRMAVSTEILLEYEEVIASRIGLERTGHALHALLLLPNVELITPFYRWKLMLIDPDDDKFIDCAIASSANRLVSHDRHFNSMKTLDFPRVEVCRIEELFVWLKEQGVLLEK